LKWRLPIDCFVSAHQDQHADERQGLSIDPNDGGSSSELDDTMADTVVVAWASWLDRLRRIRAAAAVSVSHMCDADAPWSGFDAAGRVPLSARSLWAQMRDAVARLMVVV
jgi:hypothetical protein